MTDKTLVERLREEDGLYSYAETIYAEAADRIEELEAGTAHANLTKRVAELKNRNAKLREALAACEDKDNDLS